MKTIRTLSLWLLALVLLMPLVGACGGDSDEAPPSQVVEIKPSDTPAPTDTPEPTDTPAPTDTPEPTEVVEFDAGEIMSLSNLDSYRATMTFSVAGTVAGEATEGTLEMLIEYVREPFAQHISMSAAGLEGAEDFDALEMYALGDTMYMNVAGGWISAPVDESVLSGEMLFDEDELLDDFCGGTREKDTTLNGVKVRHWSFAKADMEACMTPDEIAEIGEISDMGGNLYVAVDGNYVVRMEFFVEGKGLDASMGSAERILDEGRMEIVYEVADVNQPITIEVPPEALEGASLPEDVPIMEDAEEVANFMGMITYNSPSDAATVASFYEEALPANGWTGGEMSESSGMYMFSDYTKAGRTLNVNISWDEDAGKSQVFIAIQEE